MPRLKCVSALCPGYTYSEFHDVNGSRDAMNKAIPEGFTVTYIDRVDAQGRAEGTTVILLMPLR